MNICVMTSHRARKRLSVAFLLADRFTLSAFANFVDVLRLAADEADRSGTVLDPHSAVGVLAARASGRDRSTPMVALATAHPAKFPDAVEAATGVRPALPERLGDLFDRPERLTTLPNDLASVEAFVEAGVRPV